MSVELNPSELGFRRPFTHEVSQVLRLRNTSTDPVAFKVKTTAPKQYCVRPNSGLIEVGQDVEVQVLLQAMKEDPPLDAKCRDKFLVQSVAVGDVKNFANVASIWQHVEKTSKGSIQERKIRVVFLQAGDSSGATPVHSHNHMNGTHLHADEPPAYRSPSPTYASPGPEAVPSPNRSGAAPVGAYNTVDERPADNQHLGDARASAFNPATSGPQNSVAAAASSVLNTIPTASSVTNAIPTSGEGLKAQLAEAKAQILKLKEQAEEQVLRQRKSDAVNKDSRERLSTGTTGMGIQQQPAEGVPVPIVAALCLLSFLLAYFFF